MFPRPFAGLQATIAAPMGYCSRARNSGKQKTSGLCSAASLITSLQQPMLERSSMAAQSLRTATRQATCRIWAATPAGCSHGYGTPTRKPSCFVGHVSFGALRCRSPGSCQWSKLSLSSAFFGILHCNHIFFPTIHMYLTQLIHDGQTGG